MRICGGRLMLNPRRGTGDRRSRSPEEVLVRLLVIGKDAELASRWAVALRTEGYQVDTWARAGGPAAASSAAADYDGLIADVTGQWKHICRTIREFRRAGSRSPVLLLTRGDSAEDICRGLDAGADDYMSVPVDPAALQVRVRVLTGRVRRVATLSYRDLAMDRIRHVVTRNGDLVELTFTEFSLLEQLLLHATEAVTRDDLLQSVWAGRMDPDSNVVDVHMANLRRKLDRKGGERLIHTVRGVGYILQVESLQENAERAPPREG